MRLRKAARNNPGKIKLAFSLLIAVFFLGCNNSAKPISPEDAVRKYEADYRAAVELHQRDQPPAHVSGPVCLELLLVNIDCLSSVCREHPVLEPGLECPGSFIVFSCLGSGQREFQADRVKATSVVINARVRNDIVRRAYAETDVVNFLLVVNHSLERAYEMIKHNEFV